MTPDNAIFGIGTDIETISRFEDMDREKNSHFFEKIFTKDELNYCFKKQNPAPHLAGRFAAKEAVFKALSSAGIVELSLEKIEIQNSKDGAPKVNIHHSDFIDFTLHISISHSAELAIAFAIISKK